MASGSAERAEAFLCPKFLCLQLSVLIRMFRGQKRITRAIRPAPVPRGRLSLPVRFLVGRALRCPAQRAGTARNTVLPRAFNAIPPPPPQLTPGTTSHTVIPYLYPE